MKRVFDYFDAIYLVSSQSVALGSGGSAARLDRLSVPYQVFVNDDREAGKDDAGCSNGAKPSVAARHQAALQSLLRSDFEAALIVEDRVVFRDDLVSKMQQFVDQLRKVHWELFYLGLQLHQSGGMCTRDIGYVRSGGGLFAYAVTRKAAARIVEKIEQRRVRDPFGPIDIADPHLLRLYSIPLLAIPEPEPNLSWDLMKIQLDDYCKLFDANEFIEHSEELQRLRDHSANGALPSACDIYGHLDVPAALSMAIVRHEQGKFAMADQLYHFVIQRQPENAEAIHRSGRLAWQMGDIPRATELLYRAVLVDSSRPEFCVSLALLLFDLGRMTDALELLDNAASKNEGMPQIFNARGIVLQAMGRSEEAWENWRQALDLEPGYVEPMRWLGGRLFDERKPKEALSYLERAYEIAPTHVEIVRCLGNTLRSIGQADRAVELLAQVVSSHPLRWELHNELGLALQEKGNLKDAIVSYRRAVALKHDAALARFNLGLALLEAGDFTGGWPEYEWRRQLDTDGLLRRRFVQPEWNGCSLGGRRILVICEQGLGDAIQFVRYLSLLCARGARIILECHAPLVALFSQINFVERVIALGEPLPEFDTHARLMSLPGILHTDLDSIPCSIPYLRAEPHRVEAWRSKLGSGFHVGIVWRGSPGHLYDNLRSIPLAEFAAIAGIPNVTLVSLQQGPAMKDLEVAAFPVQSFGRYSDLGGFLDTAALLHCLDLLVSCDTSLVHLAGAMGVKTYVALPYSADWRWLTLREDSPWYPSLRLFRQTQPTNWTDVFARISTAVVQATQMQRA